MSRKICNLMMLLGLVIAGLSFIVLLIFTSFIRADFDTIGFIIIVMALGGVIYQMIQKAGLRVMIAAMVLFYIFLGFLVTMNLNCNVHFLADVGFPNWSLSNLWSRCNTFYLWLISGVMINACTSIKMRTSVRKR